MIVALAYLWLVALACAIIWSATCGSHDDQEFWQVLRVGLFVLFGPVSLAILGIVCAALAIGKLILFVGRWISE